MFLKVGKMMQGPTHNNFIENHCKEHDKKN